MSIAITLTRALPAAPTDGEEGPAVDALGVGVFADRFDAGELPDGLDKVFLEAQGFGAKAGQSCLVPGVDGALVVALGLGPEDEATVPTYRRAAAALARAAHKR